MHMGACFRTIQICPKNANNRHLISMGKITFLISKYENECEYFVKILVSLHQHENKSNMDLIQIAVPSYNYQLIRFAMKIPTKYWYYWNSYSINVYICKKYFQWIVFIISILAQKWTMQKYAGCVKDLNEKTATTNKSTVVLISMRNCISFSVTVDRIEVNRHKYKHSWRPKISDSNIYSASEWHKG